MTTTSSIHYDQSFCTIDALDCRRAPACRRHLPLPATIGANRPVSWITPPRPGDKCPFYRPHTQSHPSCS